MAGDCLHEVSSDRAPWQGDSFDEPLVLPACCVCGLIRDDRKSVPPRTTWITLKEYRHAYHVQSKELLFTHTFCPECLAQIRDRLTTSGHL
jgi:hypothetical protein